MIGAEPREAASGAPSAPSSASEFERAGLLVLDKPAGMTSHDVVDRVRRRLKVKSAGHLGTLDPGATGLLLVATGAATRCALAWQGADKTYEATVRFGLVTATQDVHGETLSTSDARPTRDAVIEAARAFAGAIEQVPPMVSALHRGGERLHALARRGVEVERAPRPVTIHAWEWLGFERQDGAAADAAADPIERAHLRVTCSAGTYVRTLAHDLGERLGMGATLERLRRVRSEPFGIERAVPLAELDHLTPEGVWVKAGIDLEQALSPLPTVTLDDAEADEIGFGGRPAIDAARATGVPLSAGPWSVVIRRAAGRVIALGELREAGDAAGDHTRLVCAHVVLPWAVRQGRPR